MARICCPKGHYHKVANGQATTPTASRITVELRKIVTEVKADELLSLTL